MSMFTEITIIISGIFVVGNIIAIQLYCSEICNSLNEIKNLLAANSDDCDCKCCDGDDDSEEEETTEASQDHRNLKLAD